ncbi:sensor histidine kinase [bacterium]|nr:sensor histidine kinase [bacterium]
MDTTSQIRILTDENDRLKQESQAKSDFLSMIVHQLRTPLSATKWIFKMMMDGDLGTVSPEQVNIIKRGFESNEQMIRMLAEISHANHVGEWKMHFDLAPTDIAECVSSAIGSFAGEAKQKNITLSFHRPDHLPLVMADKEKIGLVVQNLIENAIKYSRTGGSITIKGEVFKDQLVMSFTDTGIGIPMGSQSHIFSKFFRADNAKATDKGTGLGLFVGKEIVEGHHGTIWFESTENIGTTFFFSLPLAK